MTKEQAEGLKVGDRVLDKRRRTWRVDKRYLALNNAIWVDLKAFKDKRSYKVTEFAFLDGYTKI